MIERTNAFKVGTQGFLTLEDAQKYELRQLIPNPASAGADLTIDWIISNKNKILDILTTTPSSKTKARKINGGKKSRKADVTLTTIDGTARVKVLDQTTGQVVGSQG